MNDLFKKSISELTGLLQARSVSPVELVQALLDQIARVNPELNAIVTLAPDVIDHAREAEAALMKGQSIGALHGIPLTIKDTIETEGLRTTSGSRIRSGYVPSRDAPSVARLRSAGALVLGKTNTAEMAMDYTADNPVFGRTKNPHNHSLTPGGSSGGEAAAIASFMSPGGLGSDLAGSIRIPAHFCGIAGLKPTTGRVPGELQFPPSSGPYSLGAVIGPLARTVADLRILFRVLADEKSVVSKEAIKGLKFVWYSNDGIAPVTAETIQAVSNAARALRDEQMIGEECLPPNMDRANDLWLKVFSRASVVQLRDVYSGRENEGGSFVSWRLKTADELPTPTLDQYITYWMERDRLRAELLTWMFDHPILICPVGATPAYAHDSLRVTVNGNSMGNFRAFSYSQAFNLFDLPAATVPAGRSSDGLPIGVQIVGRPNEEELVLAVAEVVEKSGLG